MHTQKTHRMKCKETNFSTECEQISRWNGIIFLQCSYIPAEVFGLPLESAATFLEYSILIVHLRVKAWKMLTAACLLEKQTQTSSMKSEKKKIEKNRKKKHRQIVCLFTRIWFCYRFRCRCQRRHNTTSLPPTITTKNKLILQMECRRWIAFHPWQIEYFHIFSKNPYRRHIWKLDLK